MMVTKYQMMDAAQYVCLKRDGLALERYFLHVNRSVEMV